MEWNGITIEFELVVCLLLGALVRSFLVEVLGGCSKNEDE